MGIWEIFVTALIATYAMIGGAFINASLTAPANVKRLLGRITPRVHERISIIGMILGPALFWLIAYGMKLSGTKDTFDSPVDQFVTYNPVAWWAVTHGIFGCVIWGCRWIAEYLTQAEDCDRGQDEEAKQGDL